MYPDGTELERERLVLEKAERDIVAGEGRVRDQLRLALRLHASGEDTVGADRLLETFEATLAQWRAHRDLVVERIAYLEAARHFGTP